MKKVALLVAPVLAHNWMKEPASQNGNLASTAKPCPAVGATYLPLTVAPGATITTSWTQNHGGMHYIRMAPAADEAKLEDEAAAVDGTYVMAAVDNGGAAMADITAPFASGTYILQYVWNGYRNCATVVVAMNGATTAGGNSTTPGAGMDAMMNSNCVSYCEDVMTQCSGGNAQYSSMMDCMQGCATIPQTGNDGDMMGNTLQCRWTHLHVEKFDAAATHCPHSGLEGGGADHCGGTDYVPGVALQVRVMDPAQFSAMDMKMLLQTALQESGFIDCMSVGTPVLSTDEDFKNYYTVTVTFLECPAGTTSHTEQDPVLNAEALSSPEGAYPVIAYLTSKSDGMVVSGEILRYEDTNDAVAISAFGLMGLALLA